ncbi:MAG: MFS transporter [Holophaga sp.]|nr:MFS transporter [Holophaga sp.]
MNVALSSAIRRNRRLALLAQRILGQPKPVLRRGRTGRSKAPEPPSFIPKHSFRTTALIIASALFMEQLDSTVLATALPTMARSFHVSPLHMSAALTSYMLGLALFIPASGYFADRFGARLVFRLAIGVFTLGSILCGQAGSLPVLVAARLFQGIGGAMMVPVGRLVLLRTVAWKDMVSAMSWFTVPALLGPVLGPPIGGFIVTYLSWRWIFYVNVPFGILGIYLATVFIDDVREPDPGQFDLRGFFLSSISLSCLMYGLEMISRGGGESTRVTGLILAVGLVAGVGYARHARWALNPILDFRLMRIPTFSISVVGGSLTRITGGSLPFLLPMMMQVGFGYTAAQSGLITFSTAIGSFLMKTVTNPILRRFGFRTTLMWNGLIASGFLAICAGFRPSWPLMAIYATLGVGGFFQSLQFTAYNTVAYADIPQPRMSSATSFYATFQQMMLSMGICISSGLLAVSMTVLRHPAPRLSDFSVAFLGVTLISVFAAPVCSHLPRNAGSAMTGHEDGDGEPVPVI